MEQLFEIARLEAEGSESDLDALFDRFAETGADLGLETDVGFRGEQYLVCSWLWVEGGAFPHYADAKAVVDVEVAAGFFARMSSLIFDMKSMLALRNSSEHGFAIEAALCLEKSEQVFSVDLFSLWFEAASGRGDPVFGLPKLTRMLSDFMAFSPHLGPVVGLSAMDPWRRALPGWAPAHALLPDTKALREALARVPEGLFDGSALYGEDFGFERVMSEALSSLAWLEGLERAGGADDVDLAVVEYAGSDDELGEFARRFVQIGKTMGCATEMASKEGRHRCKLKGRTANVIDDSILTITMGDEGDPWPEGLFYLGDAVVTSRGDACGVVRFVKRRGEGLPSTVLFVQGSQYPGTEVLDNWIMAVSGRCEENRRQDFADFLAGRLLDGNAVERVFRLHALDEMMEGGTKPSMDAVEGLGQVSALLPGEMPDFTLAGVELEAGDVWDGAKRAAAAIERMVLGTGVRTPEKARGRRRMSGGDD